jgi:2-dehydropantoate 2-reductase
VKEDNRPRVAVVGAGAVGCYFGGLLARAGAPVTFIGRPAHVEAMTRDGLYIDGIHVRELVPVRASTDMTSVRGAELVLFCVKTLDTEAVARSLAPHVAPSALVVSLQNGVDNAERILSLAPEVDVIPAVVYVAAEMTAPGRVKHSGRGDLILGELRGRAPGDPERLRRVAALFEHAGVPCVVSKNVEADLWTKLIMNCAYNAISALTGARYGPISKDPAARDVMRHVIEEALAVARAAGVRMVDGDLLEPAWRLGETMPETISSTAQDLARGKPTEIDSLNGFVARRGTELGVATPVNHTLRALVKLAEG